MERSYRQVSDLLAVGASKTQVLRTKCKTVWNEGLSPHICRVSRNSRRKALFPEILAKMAMSGFMGSAQQ